LKNSIYQRSERGFSILEMMVAIVVMLIITGAVFSLLRDTLKTGTATLEMADAQQSLRTAHEYVSRDLMNTGDGLNSISNIRLPENFVFNYLTLNPVRDPPIPGFINLGLVTADNNVAANTLVLGTAPGTTVRANPVLTDRITILQADQTFTAITLVAGAINPDNGLAAIAETDIDKFRTGEIYFVTSSVGGIFVTVTDRQDVGTANPSLVFADGDAFGLNSVGSGGQLDVITAGATLPVSISRMKIIHYYVNSGGLLMRRVFGVRLQGFSESVIAEPVVSLQFRYFLNLKDEDGNVVQPEAQLSTSVQQTETRQVEVTLTVETPHTLQNGQRQQISMTTNTSVRNMQFRRSLQPTAGG
jgi:prepilin-type N-terminal cleavage/methylation domain-containing protein